MFAHFAVPSIVSRCYHRLNADTMYVCVWALNKGHIGKVRGVPEIMLPTEDFFSPRMLMSIDSPVHKHHSMEMLYDLKDKPGCIHVVRNLPKVLKMSLTWGLARISTRTTYRRRNNQRPYYMECSGDRFGSSRVSGLRRPHSLLPQYRATRQHGEGGGG